MTTAMPSTPYKTLSFEVTGRIGLLTLCLPERSNPLSEDLKAELRHLLGELAQNRELAALVVTGKGRAFCSGGDLRCGCGNGRHACLGGWRAAGCSASIPSI